MASEQRMARVMQYDCRYMYRIVKYLVEESQYRLLRPAEFWPDNDSQIRDAYTNVIFLGNSAKAECQAHYVKVRRIAERNGLNPLAAATIPDDLNSARLRSLLATTNTLTQPQLDTDFTPDPFNRNRPSTNKMCNDILNSAIDTLMCYIGRQEYWATEWNTITGGGAGVRRMVAAIKEHQSEFTTGFKFLLNNVESYALSRGITQDELDLRRYFFRVWFPITGSLALYNRGELFPMGAAPEEYDPNVNIQRDLGPEMG